MKKKNYYSLSLIIFVGLAHNSLQRSEISDPQKPSSVIDNDNNQHLGDLIPIPDHYYLEDNEELQGSRVDDLDYNDDDDDYEYEKDLSKGSSSPSPPKSDPNLLPDKPPTADFNYTSMPLFLKEPEDTYLIKNKLATLHCRVAHALSIHFQCNGEIVQANKLENHVEPETGIRYVDAAIKISQEQLDTFFDDYHCSCVAISSQGSKESRHALVTTTYLKKTFVTDPYSQHKAKGQQVEMRCIPPKGKPTPSTYWLKNGKKINLNLDKNFLISGSGHLIIVNARLADSGNYTCVAENVGNTRLSQMAILTIYVDGGWSEWSEWSSCSGRCNSAKQKRTRSCTKPSPVNNGASCSGGSVQKKSCDLQCQDVEAGWSSWSSWSSCNPECFQHRSRVCKSGKRQRYCPGGSDLENRNCTDGFCQSTRKLVMYGQVPPSNENQQHPTHTVNTATPSTTNLALYIVFSVAIVVFLVVIIVIVRLLRKKTVNPNGYTLTSTDYGYGSSEDGKKTSSSIGYSPDITHTLNNQATGTTFGINPGLPGGMGGPMLNQTPTATVCYEYSYPDSNSNHSKSGFIRPASEHHYEQPMVVFPPHTNPSPADSIGKPSRSESSTTTSSSNHPGSNARVPSSTSPMSIGTFENNPNLPSFPITSTPLPPTPSSSTMASVDPKFTTWATVGSSGARLSVPDCNVFLTIPPGAISHGQTLDLFLSVLHNVQHPHLLSKETLLSSVVACGPKDAAVKLKKPVIVSFPHSASLRHGNWSVSLLQNDDLTNDANLWSKVVTLGQETINTPVYAQLDLNMCHIMTDQLTGLVLVGESAKSGPATKNIRLAAFAQEGIPTADITIRVYCLTDTDDALCYVSESEKRYNGRMLDQPVSVLMQDNGDNLCLKIEQLCNGWSCQKGAEYLEVPFYHIWNSANPNLHCSFTLRSHRNSNSFSPKLLFNLAISQKESNKSVMTVNCDLSQRRGYEMLLIQQQDRSSVHPYEFTTTKFRLNHSLLQHLSSLLDPPNKEGNDWRLLAERLNVHRYITYFATRPSPTEAILHLWEARNREVLAVSNLINILRGMGRFDAATMLENDGCIR